jgi:hypothetical protein
MFVKQLGRWQKGPGKGKKIQNFLPNGMQHSVVHIDFHNLKDGYTSRYTCRYNSLPMAERAITLSTFMPQDICDRQIWPNFLAFLYGGAIVMGIKSLREGQYSFGMRMICQWVGLIGNGVGQWIFFCYYISLICLVGGIFYL